MRYEWLKDYCLKKQGAEMTFKPEWDANLFLVGSKMFVMEGADKNGVPIITLKLDPLRGDLLRQSYEGVIPGYYMNKTHWNSIYREGDVPTDDEMKSMLDESYQLIFGALTKKVQREIQPQ